MSPPEPGSAGGSPRGCSSYGRGTWGPQLCWRGSPLGQPVPRLHDPPSAGAAAREPGRMPGLSLPGNTPAFCLARRVTDGRTDSSAAVAVQAFLLCTESRVIGTPGAGRGTAPEPGGERNGPAAGSPLGAPRALGAGDSSRFAWQRPGPAELPPHRGPHREDRGLRAVALQVQSKAGLEGGGGWGCAGIPRYPHVHSPGTDPAEPSPHPHHPPSPAVSGHPCLCWGTGGFRPVRDQGGSVPVEGPLVPPTVPP